jgi:hypothetical protein
MSEAYPRLIFDRFSSKLGTRVANILKYLFPPPKHDSKRVITFANQVCWDGSINGWSVLRLVLPGLCGPLACLGKDSTLLAAI